MQLYFPGDKQELPVIIEPDTRKPLLLVVDDIPDNVQFLAARLRSKGYQVAAASGGADALRMVEIKKPDLILLDVQMPEMDGFEVCRRMQSNSETKSIPIIFLTARTELEDIVEGLNIGAVDYITKPFHSSELLTRVKTHLDLKYARDLLLEKNKELYTLNKKLLQLNTEKNEFLGVAAHDLKNPLGAVRWLVDLLLKDFNDLPKERIEEILLNIKDSIGRMNGIVMNLLDVNAIEEGKLNVEPEPVRVLVAIADVVALFEERANNKNIRVNLQNNLPNNMVTLYINSDIFTQIIENLLSNAIKYSPQNTLVTVGLSVNEKEDNKQVLVLSVNDEGPGITRKDRDRLFDKFARLSAKPTAGEHSTGLGLFIVKKLVELSNGEVWCKSNPDAGEKGATFFCELPLPLTNEVV